MSTVPKIDFLDVNFDGYQDFRVLTDESAMANESFEYWIYDPKTGEFREAPEFGDITGIDAAHKVLLGGGKEGEFQEINEYYRLEDGEPVETKSIENTFAHEVRDIVPANYPDETRVQITRLYRNGKVYRTYYSRTIRDLE